MHPDCMTILVSLQGNNRGDILVSINEEKMGYTKVQIEG